MVYMTIANKYTLKINTSKEKIIIPNIIYNCSPITNKS